MVRSPFAREIRAAVAKAGEPESQSAKPTPPPTDRAYWDKKASPATVAIADELLKLIHAFAPNFALNYNKYYIGLMENNRANNFAYFHPKKKFLRLSIKLQKSGRENGPNLPD